MSVVPRQSRRRRVRAPRAFESDTGYISVRATVAGALISVDGTIIPLAPGCDAFTTVIRHVASTIAVPQSTFVSLEVLDDSGTAHLIVEPSGQARLVARGDRHWLGVITRRRSILPYVAIVALFGAFLVIGLLTDFQWRF